MLVVKNNDVIYLITQFLLLNFGKFFVLYRIYTKFLYVQKLKLLFDYIKYVYININVSFVKFSLFMLHFYSLSYSNKKKRMMGEQIL